MRGVVRIAMVERHAWMLVEDSDLRALRSREIDGEEQRQDVNRSEEDKGADYMCKEKLLECLATLCRITQITLLPTGKQSTIESVVKRR